MKIVFSHSLSNGGTLRFSAPVIASHVATRAPYILVPKRVRSIPFPPFGGKAVVRLKPELRNAIQP